jgi:hypothetical protein
MRAPILSVCVSLAVACGGSSSGDDTDGTIPDASVDGSPGHDAGSKDATHRDVSNDVATGDVTGDVAIHDGATMTDGPVLSMCGSLIDGGMGKEYFGACPGTEKCCPGNKADTFSCKALDGGMCPLLP